MFDTLAKVQTLGGDKMSEFISICGSDCSVCKSLKTCGGCKNAKGKVFYLKGDTCPLYECATKKPCKNCGGCNIKQCKKFMSYKDPSMSEEEFEKWVDIKIDNLKNNRK